MVTSAAQYFFPVVVIFVQNCTKTAGRGRSLGGPCPSSSGRRKAHHNRLQLQLRFVLDLGCGNDGCTLLVSILSVLDVGGVDS